MSLRRGEQDPDKCLPSSPGFSLGFIPCVTGGHGRQELPGFPSLWTGAFRPVCCSGQRKAGQGKHAQLPAPALHPSAVCSGLCVLEPSSPYRWALLAPGTEALVLDLSPAGDGRWSELGLCQPEDLEVSEAARAGMSPRSAPFYWHRNI